VQNFQIVIISAVKICMQCLQIASASVDSPRSPTGALPLEHTAGLLSPRPTGLWPPKFLCVLKAGGIYRFTTW